MFWSIHSQCSAQYSHIVLLASRPSCHNNKQSLVMFNTLLLLSSILSPYSTQDSLNILFNTLFLFCSILSQSSAQCFINGLLNTLSVFCSILYIYILLNTLFIFCSMISYCYVQYYLNVLFNTFQYFAQYNLNDFLKILSMFI